ncbi:hypothetical protein D3C80_216540 [compost metagenome]
MRNTMSHSPSTLRHGLLASAILAASLPAAQAFEFDTGSEDWAIRFDNTVKYNYGVRTESADAKLLGTPNNNDGDYNFRKSGTNVTNRVDLLSELDVIYQNRMGFRVSAASWYDKAYENAGSNSNPYQNTLDTSGFTALTGLGRPGLSSYTDRYYNGPSGEILDAFVFGSMELGEESLLSAKAGRHNIFWGETVLSPVHGISYGQSGLDLAKAAAAPGIEAKELFVPRNQLSVNFTINPELTVAAQYFFEWDPARTSQPGTFYGGSDLSGYGAQNFLLGHNILGNPIPAISTRYADDFEPSQHGDFGVMVKWSPEWLNGTLGAYYRNTSDIIGQPVLNAGSVPPLTPAAVAGTSYSFAYGDDIDIYGLSLSKSLGDVSVGVDLNYRENMPLSSIATIFSPNLYAAVQPLINAGRAPSQESMGLVNVLPDDGETGGARGKTGHLVINALATFGDTPLWDSSSLLAEFYGSRYFSVTEGKALFKGADTYTGIDKVTRSSYGVAVNFTPTWYQVFPGVDLSAPLSINHGLHGHSAVVGGGDEGAGQYGVGLAADVYSRYRFDLKYVDYYGKADTCNNPATDGASQNPLDAAGGFRRTCWKGSYSAFAGGPAQLKDRGALYFTFKTTF